MLGLGFLVFALLAVVSSGQQLARVISSCTVPGTVALTFDDGPYIYLQDIVNTLDGAGITGTFFFNGNNWGCIYDEQYSSSVLYALQHGHQVGAHTWSHADLTTLNSDQINTEMGRIEDALWKIAGIYPALMRPPYGNYNNLVLQVVAQRNQSAVMWDFDDGDSTGATVAQSEGDYDTLAANKPNTVLALNHETYETTAHQVLPYAIQKLKAAGYTRFVSVAECVGLDSPYQRTQAPGTRDSTWTC